MTEFTLVPGMFLDDILLAFALGALVGLEREGVPEKKYAGVRTLSIFCAGGPISVKIMDISGSVLPVVVYLLLGAVFSLLVVYIRVWKEQEDLGLTTSSTVFLMGLVGVMVGYDHLANQPGYQFDEFDPLFVAVSVTLITVLLLSEKDMFTRYTELLSEEEMSDAAKLGVLALVLYPVLPQGAVDPYGVVFLRKALLFVIFILLIQFAAYVSLRWLRSSAGFIASAALGGVVSSLAVVTAVADYFRDGKIKDAAYAGSVVAVVAAILRNGFIAATLAPELLRPLIAPFVTAAAVGLVFVGWYYRCADTDTDIDIESNSPFSFSGAFKFGLIFLAILMVTEVAQTHLSSFGVYATAAVAAVGSSTAVVASAVTLFQSGELAVAEAAMMIVVGALSSMLSKLVYTEVGGVRELTKHLLVPYLLMGLALLTILL